MYVPSAVMIEKSREDTIAALRKLCKTLENTLYLLGLRRDRLVLQN